MKYHNTLDAATYFQTAAENSALYYQSFALAELRLIAELARRRGAGQKESSLYVVSDCDETLLDNSAYNGWLIETGRDFHDQSWSEWCQRREATATPGAVDFSKFVVEHGARLIYVSSRFEADREATADNLRALGFPLPDATPDPEVTFLFLSGMVIDGTPGKKGAQFAYLAQRFGVPPILHLGDNLSDHDANRYGSKVPAPERLARAHQDAHRWGTDWIVFPNSIYGTWRNTLAAADESPPVPFQEAPVRPSAAEAPKTALLRRWKP